MLYFDIFICVAYILFMFFSTILLKKKTSKHQIKQHYIHTKITINDGIKLIILMNVIFSWQTRSFLFWQRNSFCMIWTSSNTKDILSGKEFYITNLNYNVTTEKVCYVKNEKKWYHFFSRLKQSSAFHQNFGKEFVIRNWNATSFFGSNKSAILKFFEGKCNNDIPYISAKK